VPSNGSTLAWQERVRFRKPGLIALPFLLFMVRPALAADPLNSANKVAAPTREPTERGAGARSELNILPVVGGNTDIGIGGGYFAGLARIKKGVDPYMWNLESAGFVTFKPREGGGVLMPYQDVFVKLTVPRFLGSPTRLEVKPEYSWETLGYYGLGNASSAKRPDGTNQQYFEYVRVHPVILATLHTRVIDHIAVTTGAGFTQNWLEIKNGTRLDSDLRSGDAETRRLLGPARADHPVIFFKYGAVFDTRDNEFSPTKGTFNEVDLKLAPGSDQSKLPHRYGQTTLVLRTYTSLIKERLVLAGRLVGDALFGDVPFYELTRFADTYAIGGVNGVRGVPAQRYSGRVKAFGNVELRGDIVKFKLLGKDMSAGAAVFFDAGRVWADTKAEPTLDGTGLGLKYGVGAGARLRSGNAFLLRLDVAWSPDATPIGAYLATGEIF
jgi:outer membrane protein assembly factor BamA